ncbi:MAG: hypothetical protein GAK45_01563 [Pseudomonas citronellolis]|nr:MAG: hypothetical protein GAK45_01563 [Pseudomonas citronellolis]
MHVSPLYLAASQGRAAPAGDPVRLSRERCRWLTLQPLSLPLELAFWALWHCRHARPPDHTSH